MFSEGIRFLAIMAFTYYIYMWFAKKFLGEM